MATRTRNLGTATENETPIQSKMILVIHGRNILGKFGSSSKCNFIDRYSATPERDAYYNGFQEALSIDKIASQNSFKALNGSACGNLVQFIQKIKPGTHFVLNYFFR